MLVYCFLEGYADDDGVRVRERQSNSIFHPVRQEVRETMPSRTLFMLLGLQDETLTFQAG